MYPQVFMYEIVHTVGICNKAKEVMSADISVVW